jgi:hypothetical protein
MYCHSTLKYNLTMANSAEVQCYQKRVMPKQVHTSEDFAEITRTPLTFAVLRSTPKYVDVRQRSFTGGVNNSSRPRLIHFITSLHIHFFSAMHSDADKQLATTIRYDSEVDDQIVFFLVVPTVYTMHAI